MPAWLFLPSQVESVRRVVLGIDAVEELPDHEVVGVPLPGLDLPEPGLRVRVDWYHGEHGHAVTVQYPSWIKMSATFRWIPSSDFNVCSSIVYRGISKSGSPEKLSVAELDFILKLPQKTG